ncbi:MAG: four helix bundle protein [Bacteroidales bacterium]|nr:four helix bundle protein [Bacteroidales bacterium]
MKKIIEKRLIDLALAINDLCQKLNGSYISQHLKTQIIRSSTSAALNYAEAQVAESREDASDSKKKPRNIKNAKCQMPNAKCSMKY